MPSLRSLISRVTYLTFWITCFRLSITISQNLGREMVLFWCFLELIVHCIAVSLPYFRQLLSPINQNYPQNVLRAYEKIILIGRFLSCLLWSNTLKSLIRKIKILLKIHAFKFKCDILTWDYYKDCIIFSCVTIKLFICSNEIHISRVSA